MKSIMFKRKLQRHLDKINRELRELDNMVPFFDTPENYRSERVDDAPHA